MAYTPKNKGLEVGKFVYIKAKFAKNVFKIIIILK